ncbi:MAG: hemolysin family protein [Flavobacteriia bacterium]
MEIIIIFFLTLLNGFFALSEISLVSVKRSRIEHLADQGNTRAKTILHLLENPENFLSSVQVGITLIGIVSGAFGGATLTDDMDSVLSQISFLEGYSHLISLILVIGSITYFTIVIGELVPKTIAMNNAENIALITSPIIKYFTLATFPFVKLLSISTNLILKLFGVKENESDHMSEEELKFMLFNAGKQGVLETDESQVHQNLFYFTDQTAKSLMTHNSEVEWIDLNHSTEDILTQLLKSVHSKFIVCDGQMSKIKGVVTIKDFLENYQSENFNIINIMQEPIFIVQNTPAFKILNLFRSKKQYIGAVIDEYGGVVGVITLHDLIEAIVGDLPDEDEVDTLDIIQRTDGTYLINGKTLIFELNQYFQREIIEDNVSNYTTIAGFMLEHLKSIPHAGNTVVYGNYHFEIVDIDGLRIDKILMSQVDQKSEDSKSE